MLARSKCRRSIALCKRQEFDYEIVGLVIESYYVLDNVADMLLSEVFMLSDDVSRNSLFLTYVSIHFS